MSARREVALTSLSMDHDEAVRKETGATVNDVILASCSGALLAHSGSSFGDIAPLVAAVPVLAQRRDAGRMGNPGLGDE